MRRRKIVLRFGGKVDTCYEMTCTRIRTTAGIIQHSHQNERYEVASKREGVVDWGRSYNGILEQDLCVLSTQQAKTEHAEAGTMY
jgi:hypothetical protein